MNTRATEWRFPVAAPARSEVEAPTESNTSSLVRPLQEPVTQVKHKPHCRTCECHECDDEDDFDF